MTSQLSTYSSDRLNATEAGVDATRTRHGSRSDRGEARTEGLRSKDSCGWSRSKTEAYVWTPAEWANGGRWWREPTESGGGAVERRSGGVEIKSRRRTEGEPNETTKTDRKAGL